MDPTTAAGVAVLIAKLGAFALIIRASMKATRAVREVEARRATEREADAARGRTAPAEPLREAA